MRVEERAASDAVLQARERYVPRGLAPTELIVSRAWGAKIWDADGKEYLDFAGGIACQNVGHGNASVVRAIHEQVDKYLHQCAVVGLYEPYIDVARRLDDLWPGNAPTKTLLINSGAEAVENAVKIARAATGRAGVIAFDRAFHGRTNLAMTLTSKLVYKQGFGPLATDVHRAPAPYPYRGVSTEDALHGLDLLFKQEVDPRDVACFVLEPVQGEGGFIPMSTEFVRALKAKCEEHGILYVDDEVQAGCGRTGPVWAIEHFGIEPDLLVSGKTLGGGLPLGGVTGRTELMDSVHPGGLGSTFGGNPVSCAAALAVLDEISAPGFRARADQIAKLLRARLDEIASRHSIVGEVRGLGSMLAIEFADQNDRAAKATARSAFERGLVILTCGLYGNVIRLLPPLTATDDELDQGLAILEASIGDAAG